MVCELKITSESKKNCVKILWWSNILLNSISEKQGYSTYEIPNRYLILLSIEFEFSPVGRIEEE